MMQNCDRTHYKSTIFLTWDVSLAFLVLIKFAVNQTAINFANKYPLTPVEDDYTYHTHVMEPVLLSYKTSSKNIREYIPTLNFIDLSTSKKFDDLYQRDDDKNLAENFPS